ncbi:predicted protein [Nematostella vectensis]|uniref:Death domain-containing protein n=1 Tax=Nematostella vectensis TaxID=45351 RepID=A7T1T0_NEMVE|nr:predicted protein [Nematostella vectensis]|eukprot:XP_001622191.1 predicted protein [Nematostella vectensis]
MRAIQEGVRKYVNYYKPRWNKPSTNLQSELEPRYINFIGICINPNPRRERTLLRKQEQLQRHLTAVALMAGRFPINKDLENFSRLLRLLIDGGTEAFRIVFSRLHPSLSASLSLHQITLYGLWRPPRGKKKILTDKQWYKLYPPTGSPNIQDFDITLLFVLLRNICPSLKPPPKGWDILPSIADNSLEANLVRIRCLRNELYGHIKAAALKDVEFEDYWKRISLPLIALGISADEIDDLKTRPSKEVIRPIHEVRQKLDDVTNKDLDEAERVEFAKQEKVPVEILVKGPEAERAYRKALLEGKVQVYRGRIMLIGQDRAGKTSLKKSLLGLRFDPQEESTEGIEVDPSRFEVDVEQVRPWQKSDETESVSQSDDAIALMVYENLRARKKDEQPIRVGEDRLSSMQKEKVLEALKDSMSKLWLEENLVQEPPTSVKQEDLDESETTVGIPVPDCRWQLPERIEKKIIDLLRKGDNSLSEKRKEIVLDAWDFAGQHLYYATHPVFFSSRAVYVLTHNLSKDLRKKAEPCDYGIECCGIMIDGESDMEVLKDVVEQHKQEIINECSSPQAGQTRDDVSRTIQECITNWQRERIEKKIIDLLRKGDNSLSEKRKEIVLDAWDFAGQHLYYATHPVFFSSRAVYVLTHNLSKDLRKKAEPCVRQGVVKKKLDNANNETNLENLISWLVTVHCVQNLEERDKDCKRFPEKTDTTLTSTIKHLRPPVLIVGTHADKPSIPVEQAHAILAEAICGKRYDEHVIRPFFAVDNSKSSDEKGIQDLRTKIESVLKSEPYMGETLPAKWFNFEKAIAQQIERNVYFLQLSEVRRIAQYECFIADDVEFNTMLNFFHDLRVIVKHAGTVVLQSQWLVNLFKKLITIRTFNEMDPSRAKHWKTLEETGVLHQSLIDDVFGEFVPGNSQTQQDLLSMMERYGLVARFNAPDENGKESLQFLVPAQLTSSPEFKVFPNDCDPCALLIHFPDGFVPHGLFPQLESRLVKHFGFTSPSRLFRNGARFVIGTKNQNDLFLLCGKRYIKVILTLTTCTGDVCEQGLAVRVRMLLEESLDELSRDWDWLGHLRYEFCVECSVCASENCQEHGRTGCGDQDCVHVLKCVHGRETPYRCDRVFGDGFYLPGLTRWFNNEVETQDYGIECCGIMIDGESDMEVLKDVVEQHKQEIINECSSPQAVPTRDDVSRTIQECITNWQRGGGRKLFQELTVLQDEKTLLSWLDCDENGNNRSRYIANLLLKGKHILQSPLASLEIFGIEDISCILTTSHKPEAWKSVARCLTKETLIESCVHDYRDTLEQCTQVLLAWARKEGRGATLRRVFNALRRCQERQKMPDVAYSHIYEKLARVVTGEAKKSVVEPQ